MNIPLTVMLFVLLSLLMISCSATKTGSSNKPRDNKVRSSFCKMLFALVIQFTHVLQSVGLLFYC